MDGAIDAGVLEQIKSILRRDLKLGADAVINDDMPMAGGDADLDSLDILLVVSSIEKQFKIKIPNEIIGRRIFENVSTLARFVQDNQEKLSTANTTPGVVVQKDWLSMLPHGPEFRFVSQVREVSPGKRASGVWNVNGSEPFFAGHFPGRPIVPGVLLTEAMAQVAGLAASDVAGHRGGMLVHTDVRFDAPVVPPASIELDATVTRAMDALRVCEVMASVGGKRVARGSVTIRFE